MSVRTPGRKTRRRLRGERGYTLIEMILASAAALVVAAAAMAMIATGLHFAGGDAARVDSTQQASTAMERIVQALNSACVVGVGVSPIVGATGASAATGSTGVSVSSANSITFFSSLTDTPTIGFPNEEVIYLSSTNGPLDMATYSYTSGPGGTIGSYSFTPTSTAVLVPHAAPSGSTPTQATTTPIFTYYGYDPSSGTLSDQYATSPNLGATNAAQTAQVAINFEAQPQDGTNPAHGSVDLANAVTLRLTAVSNYPSPSTGATVPTPCS